MAKKSYHWRYSLDASRLDVSLAFKSSNGVGIRPVPVRLVLAVIASGLLCFWIVQVSPLMSMGPAWVAGFVLFWIVASCVLLKPDKSGHLAFEQLPVLVDYAPKSARRVYTRSTSPAWGALNVIGVASVDPDSGMITFSDDSVGYLYRVVGSASTLLFESDRNAIIDRVDAFYRSMKCDYEFTFITTREAQKVKRQVAAMDKRIAMLERDPELKELAELARSERDVLAKKIGREFKSMHQYLLIRSQTVEGLQMGRSMFQSEVESSQYMFKRAQALFDADDEGNMTWELTDVLRSIYGPLPVARRKVADATASAPATEGLVNYGTSR